MILLELFIPHHLKHLTEHYDLSNNELFLYNFFHKQLLVLFFYLLFTNSSSLNIILLAFTLFLIIDINMHTVILFLNYNLFHLLVPCLHFNKSKNIYLQHYHFYNSQTIIQYQKNVFLIYKNNFLILRIYFVI